MNAQMQDINALKMQANSKPGRSIFGMAALFTAGGSFLLLMLALVPIWNAAALLNNFNYLFWEGGNVPTYTIVVCLCIVFLFAVTSGIFFTRTQGPMQTEQTIMTIVTIFVTLFGLSLMIMSLPLTRQSDRISTDLLQNCAYSAQTHRLYEYSQVLQNIRASPACAKKFSVEECAGYQAAPPYTDFLKQMESEFYCAGFCYKAGSPAAAAAALVGLGADIEHRRVLNSVHSSNTYPPTLFSDANYQATCDGMAQREMKNFAGDIGEQTYYQGVYLIVISVAVGFLKLLGLCARKA